MKMGKVQLSRYSWVNRVCTLWLGVVGGVVGAGLSGVGAARASR